MTATAEKATKRNGRIGGEVPTNGAEQTIVEGAPYTVLVSVQGTSDLLCHRWNCEAVDAKAAAPKGSKAKKRDDLESYIYRNENGEICLPGEYLRQAIIGAAKYRQDPRSPRKSAMDLFKAGVIVETQLASLGTKDWNYIDTRRVTVQRNGVNRSRPAFHAGWRAEFTLTVLLPEYINKEALLDVLGQAGRLVGLADFRPTYGRFAVVAFEVL